MREVPQTKGKLLPMSLSIGVFYGSTTGNTESIAQKIKEQLGNKVSHLADVNVADPAELEQYDLILMGVPTWDVGEMQIDWDDFIPRMEGLNLAGKKVAFFGVGDAEGYPDNFLDAVGMLWEAVKPLGGPQLIGVWPTEGYSFNESRGLHDETHFLGLGLDEDNEPELTDGRIQDWLTQIVKEAGISDENATN